MGFPERLRVSMALYGLLPRDLARRARLDPAYISRILAGKQSCPIVTRRRLMEAIYRDDLQESSMPAPERADAAA